MVVLQITLKYTVNSDNMRQTFKLESVVLAGWLSWLEHYPIHQKVAGLIPGQATYT